jgi:predicted ester cyclase
MEVLSRLSTPAYFELTAGMLNFVNSTFAEHVLEIKELIAEGNNVMARMHSKGRHTGEFFGVPGTGRQWEDNEGAVIFRLEDGKVADGWQIWNIPLHFEKLGFKMTVVA